MNNFDIFKNIEQRNGWVLALSNGAVIGGVKEEYLKAFYLKPRD